MIRLVFCIVLLLISLLAVFKAPEYYLWMLAVLVTEYQWVFIAMNIMVLLTGFYTNKHLLAGTLTGIIALMLFASPVIRAYWLAGSLSENFATAFNTGGSNDKKPFSFWSQFK